MRSWCSGVGLVLLALSLAFSGCRGTPVSAPEPLQEATADQLTELLRARAAAIQSAKGLFHAQIKGPGLLLPARVNGTVHYSRPDAFRVRGFGAFGGDLFELVIHRAAFRLSLPTEGQVLRGATSDLGRIAKFGRPVQLSLLAVYGALGLTTVGTDESVSLFEEGDRYRLDVRRPGVDMAEGAVRRLWFDRRTLLMVQEEWLGPDGQSEAVMRYEDYRAIPLALSATTSLPRPAPTAPMLHPYRIEMQDGRGRGTVRLTFQEMVPNIPIGPEELGTI